MAAGINRADDFLLACGVIRTKCAPSRVDALVHGSDYACPAKLAFALGRQRLRRKSRRTYRPSHTSFCQENRILRGQCPEVQEPRPTKGGTHHLISWSRQIF